MEDYSNPLNLLLRRNEASKKPFTKKSSSRKGHRRSAKRSKLRTPCNVEYFQAHTEEMKYSSDDSFHYVPIEERVLKKLKRERKFLKKWTVELNQAKSEICNPNGDEFSSVEPNMSEIEKRYHILLPAIKLAMDTMDQATFSRSSAKDPSSMKTLIQQGNDQPRKIQESLNEDVTARGLAERRRPQWLKESKEYTLLSANGTHQCISEKNLSNPDLKNCAVTDISKHQLARRAREQYVGSKKIQDNIKAKCSNEIEAPQCLKDDIQPSKKPITRRVKKSIIQHNQPGADGEIMKEINMSNHIKRTVNVKGDTRKSVFKHVADEKVMKGARKVQTRVGFIRDKSKKTPRQAVVSIENKYHSSRHFREVEQNVLCTGPNLSPTYNTPSSSGEKEPSVDFASDDLQMSPASIQRNPTSLKTISNAVSINSLEGQTKCKCKDNKSTEPCICKCCCEEQSGIYDSKMSTEQALSSNVEQVRSIRRKPSLEPKNQESKVVVVEPVLSSVPSSSSEEGRWIKRKASRESMQVQTSFPSSIGPCKPDTCPKRQKRFVENRDIEVQTDDTDIEWQYEPTVTHFKRDVASPFKIPPKRTATMDDRLLRRIMYFDRHQSSVCNKNVQFCTYNVHKTKKGFPKDAEKVPCPDCPGSRKCKIVLTQHPYHLTCNEIVVEVKSLALNQEGADSLMKVCSFLYIDYVFLGHVGNETNLAPVSSNVFFDSRKTYSVSLRFNKKERSILREQFNPSGLLVKDSIMFIVVCQAAPEFDINKNWDFGFGYLSMKQIGEQIGSEDKKCVDVEMQKIGGTKSNIGRLLVAIEGLKTIRVIMNEELRCIEPQVDAVMKKLKLNKKEVAAMENNQTTCKRRTTKRKK